MPRWEARLAANFFSAAASFSTSAAIDRFDQGVSRGKVAIQSSRSHPCLFGNVVQAGVRARAGKRLLRHLQNALAVALRVGARFSRDRRFLLFRRPW